MTVQAKFLQTRPGMWSDIVNFGRGTRGLGMQLVLVKQCVAGKRQALWCLCFALY